MSSKSIFEGKTLLITGGTGSFGQAATKVFLSYNLKEIRILSRDEKKQDDMRHQINDERLKFFIGDVRDLAGLDDAFKGVDYVFSAAALKQVPSCEFFPLEAVKTNVLGSDNVITACFKHGVKKAVFLSTDKAVYPSNAMGMSKALMEKNVIARSRNALPNETILNLTRFGNVLMTRGSVIPLFLDQIKASKPITLTDPEMTRFMMSMGDAIELVSYAFENGKQGEIFVKKAPSVKMITLAQALIDLIGSKSKIEIIGARHGEKKHEVLISEEEASRSADFGDFLMVAPDLRSLNYCSCGEQKTNSQSPLTSNGDHLLNLEQTKDLLLSNSILSQK